MATGIEHKSADSVLQAYDYFDKPNFAIFAGRVLRDVYEGDNIDDGSKRLSDFLNMIESSNTSAVYTLQVYREGTHNINNKTPHNGSTTFMLNSAQPVRTENGVTVIERNNTVGNVHNPLMQQLIESQKQTNELIVRMLTKQEGDKIDKLIGFLEQNAQQPKETMTDKLVELGKALLEKPDIIDRIGYVIRPSLYQRQEPYQEQPAEQQIRGTDKKEEDTMAATNATEPKELTEEETEQLNNRLDAALDAVEDITGLELLVQVLECLASQKPEKIAKLTPEKLASAFAFL